MLQSSYNVTLCANMTETPCVTAISEQGGKEKTQHDNGKLSGVNYFSRSTTTISPDDDNYKLADRSLVALH
jgi:hypothetical protein